MRQPTTQRDAFTWYRAAVFGDPVDAPAIVLDDPQCGYFLVTVVKGGVLVPAVIWLDQDIDERGELADDERMRCQVNGEEKDPAEAWVWLAAHPVPFAKYQHHLNLNMHSGWYGLNVPEANPSKPIDWMRVEPPVFRD